MKQLFVISFFLLSSFFLNAQGFSFGPKVGANISGLSGLQFKDGYQFGYHLGGFAEIMFSEKLGIQPELLWSQTALQTGTSLADLPPSLPGLTKIKLNYIAIPLLLNIRPAKFITFQVGPQFGILRNSKSSLTSDVESAFKSGEFSMLAGVQFKFLSFRVYGRYGIGLTNINDLSNQDAWESRTLQVGLGLGL